MDWKKVLIAAVLIGIVVLAGCVQTQPRGDDGFPEDGNPIVAEPLEPVAEPSQRILKFDSVNDLRVFLARNQSNAVQKSLGSASAMSSVMRAFSNESAVGAPAPQAAEDASAGSQSAGDYSQTNVQVQGVDEADIVKNDDRYLYLIHNNELFIIDGLSAENGTVVSQTKLLDWIGNGTGNANNEGANGIAPRYYWQQPQVQQLLLKGNSLVVFVQGYEPDTYLSPFDLNPIESNRPKTVVLLLDVSDKAHPQKRFSAEASGNYSESRLIGNTVYFVSQEYTNSYYGRPVAEPLVKENDRVMHPSIYYFDNPEDEYVFHTIASINLDNGSVTDSKTLMLGYSNTVYVSNDHLYIAYKKNNYYCGWWYYSRCGNDWQQEQQDRFFNIVVPLLPQETQDQINSINSGTENVNEKWDKISAEILPLLKKAKEDDAQMKLMFDRIAIALEEYDTEKAVAENETIIHKLSLDNGQIEYKSRGAVQGDLLNQFSLDEKDGYLRVATTLSIWVQESILTNNVFVLDESMNTVGRLTDIARDERIEAARFTGDKLYLVTFRRIDPFFVIDLSNPSAPRIDGELKLPGYSEYLHPLDDTHIIGVGMDATEEGRTTGLKIALFDVSNPAAPSVVKTLSFGEEGSNSAVLQDHKAFLLSNNKDKIVLPVSLIQKRERVGEYNYRTTSWNGAIVLKVSPAELTELGRIEHSSTTQDYYNWWSTSNVKRSLYLDNKLFTISNEFVKVNDWSQEGIPSLQSIALPEAEQDYRGYPMPVDEVAVVN